MGKYLRFHHLNEHTTMKRYMSSYLGKGLKIKFVGIPSLNNKDMVSLSFDDDIYYNFIK